MGISIWVTRMDTLLLQKLIALGAPFVLFNRMPFWEEEEDAIVIQYSKLGHNGPGPAVLDATTNHPICYPETILSRRKFDMAINKQYKLLFTYHLSEQYKLIEVKKVKSMGLFYAKI